MAESDGMLAEEASMATGAAAVAVPTERRMREAVGMSFIIKLIRYVFAFSFCVKVVVGRGFEFNPFSYRSILTARISSNAPAELFNGTHVAEKKETPILLISSP
jgi:hypothetical protein